MFKLISADKKLLKAASKGKLKTVQKLLETETFFHRKASVNTRDPKKNTPLILAAQNGHLNVVKYLLEHGADIDSRNQGNNTALILATLFRQKPVVYYLVEQGADLNIINHCGDTALSYATCGCIDYDLSWYLEGVYKNPEKFQNKTQETLKQQIDNLSTDKLADLPQSDPELLQKIIIFGQLASVFERLPYEQQMPLYKASKDKMKPDEKKSIENIIRATRQKQGAK